MKSTVISNTEGKKQTLYNRLGLTRNAGKNLFWAKKLFVS